MMVEPPAVKRRTEVVRVADMSACPMTSVQSVARAAKSGMERCRRVCPRWRPSGVPGARENARTVRRANVSARPVTGIEGMTAATNRGMRCTRRMGGGESPA